VRSRRTVQALLLTTLIGVGLWVRNLPPRRLAPGSASAWPWKSTTMATLYFTDGRFFFPVSRWMHADNDWPRATLEALLAGPRKSSGLSNSVPSGVAIHSFQIASSVAHVDLSTAVLAERGDAHTAETAIVQTLTALPGVSSVALSVDGKPLGDVASRLPMLYYASANGLVAIPASSRDPRAMLTEYLSGPPDPELTGLPPDVRLLNYDYQASGGLLSLNFSYTPSLHALALDKPERMRTVLLGLIAGLTELPQVRAVRLEFEGHTHLGLGQCSDLLQTPQPHPELLNDERLLGR
jgi:spore germination protein GerM